MVALKRREMVLAYAAVGALVLWAVVRAIFVPFQEKLATQGRTLRREEARFKKGAALRDHGDVITSEYAKYETYFSLAGVSDEEAVAAFLKEIEKLSRETEFTIVDMKPQKTVETDKFSREFQIVVKAESGMGELVKFLYALYASPLLFDVEKMTLVPKGEETPTLTSTITVAGVLFT
ncbi:MAG: hypothetical protein ACM3L6_02195 [Deltaproteobacteria bacterium]